MQNKVVKNAAWIIACKLIQTIFSIIVTMLSARFLGPSGYGLINYAASIVTFVVPIMQLGMNNVLVQEIVNFPNEEGKVLGSAVILNFISSFACIVGVVSFVLIANAGETETLIVCALYSTLLIFQAFEILQYWFQAKLLSKYTSIVTLIAYVAMSIYKIILLATGQSIYLFAVSQAFDYLIIAIFLLVIYKRKGTEKLRFSLDVAKRIFSKSKYYIVSSLMVTLFAQTDKIMIKLMMGDESTGYYAAAVSCASMVYFIFVAIIDSVRPSIFESKKVDNKVFERKVSCLYTIIIYLSLAVSFIITIFAPMIVDILYGVEYVPTISALRIIVWYTTFSYLGTVRNIWILAENKQKYLWILNLSGAMINIILNSIFIPIWGINGAATASLITQVFTNVIMNVIVWPLRRNNLLLLKGLNVKLLLDMAKKKV